MDIIRTAIERPVAVVAVVLMVMVFGYVALTTIPIQLAPDVNKPVIQVTTTWSGAAPAEIEREILIRQEEVLKGLEGLDEMSSSAQPGRGRITLEFRIGTNMDRALLLVSNRLSQVSGYPAEVNEPILSTAGNEDNPIARFSLRRLPGNTTVIDEYGDLVEDVIKPRLERVPGVGQIEVFGGSPRELRVIVDPARMAQYGLTVSDVVDTLRAASVSLSAGSVDEGKREYIVRAEGELSTPDEVRQVVVRTLRDPQSGRQARVTVGDVATVEFGFRDRTATIRYLGEPAISLGAIREAGANVITTMDGLREAVDELNRGALNDQAMELRLTYDETEYIESAISLVRTNILVGGSLATLVLLLFLRSWRATVVIGLAIPVSIIGSFVAMAALGRSINVISLAGIAFAVGMVVDAAIVVLENIYRLRQQGRPVMEAAWLGARQVWGAVLVSAATTVMVFLPLLLMQLEVGQLFRDIAVAISVAVSLSLIVAITVIPTLSCKLLSGARSHAPLRIPVLDDAAGAFRRGIMGMVRFLVTHRPLAFAVVAAITGGALAFTWAFLPKLEYLPEGNRNLVFASTQPPPGYNLATTTVGAARIEDAVRPLWVSETGPGPDPEGRVKIEHFFFVATRGRTFVGATAQDPERAGDLIPLLREEAFAEPGTFGFVIQPSLFGRGVGGARSISLDVSGPELDVLLEVAAEAAARTDAAFPRAAGHQMRPQPGLELGAPEIRVVPDRVRLADSGVSARDLALSVDVFNDGMRVAEVTVGGRRIDLRLQGPAEAVQDIQSINYLPVVTVDRTIVPVGTLARVELTSGPTEIRRLERQRTVTLQIRPASGMALEEAIERVREEVIAPLAESGLPAGVSLSLSGTADQLTQTWNAMQWQLLLAVLTVYLVMAVLFESFKYPLIILFSVPLATAGAVVGLVVLNRFTYQPLDMLTLLGFVILIGTVVNNAILLVHQTLYLVREEGMARVESIVEATGNRVRPIFMSTLTSGAGMAPLVLFPGAGSELYRGLGSVVIGGLSLSAVLTLAIVPLLLGLVMRDPETVAAPEPVDPARPVRGT